LRARLIQQSVIASREALAIQSLLALAQQTGFRRVREILLKRFDLQRGHLIAREHWWLKELVALNERLRAKLERGERMTPQELMGIEPLRLKNLEKQEGSESPPLAATLKSALFDPPCPARSVPDAPVRCCAG
jgi:hypothetical protein